MAGKGSDFDEIDHGFNPMQLLLVRKEQLNIAWVVGASWCLKKGHLILKKFTELGLLRQYIPFVEHVFQEYLNICLY